MIRDDLDRQRDSWPFRPSAFDVVIAADILEHMRQPERLLRMARWSLAPKGVLIASIPNLARLEVRLSLLVGQFRYGERGLLDRTHYRLFTKSTALQALRDSGFVPRVVDVTGLASRLHLPRFVHGLFAYQFIIIGEPANEPAPIV